VTELIDDLGKATASPDLQKTEPMKVQVANGAEDLLALARSSLTPLVSPLAGFAVVVLLGRYFSTFHFFSVLLASDPPAATEVELIRLLTENRFPEAKALLHEVTGTRLTLQAAEDVVVPTVRAIENDLFPGAASNAVKGRVYQQMRELLEGLALPETAEADGHPVEPVDAGLMIVPFVGEGDEIVGQVLAVLLRAEGVSARLLSGRMLRAEKLTRLREAAATFIVLSSIETRSAPAVDKMARSLRVSFPQATLLVGLWSLPPQGAARLLKRLEDTAIGGVYTNLQQAVRGIVSLNAPTVGETLPEAIRPESAAAAPPG
jgi:hypothetical protein